jgi:hypothetical protein
MRHPNLYHPWPIEQAIRLEREAHADQKLVDPVHLQLYGLI